MGVLESDHQETVPLIPSMQVARSPIVRFLTLIAGQNIHSRERRHFCDLFDMRWCLAAPALSGIPEVCS